MNPQLEDSACLYVLDRLDAQEKAAFEALLPNKPELAALVRELGSGVSRRVRALPQLDPPARLLQDIEARIDRLPARFPVAPPRRGTSWTAVAKWGIAAVIAVGIGILAVQSLRRPAVAVDRSYVIVIGLDSVTSKLAELPMQDRPVNSDASFIQLASLAEKYWEKPEDMPVKLDSASLGGRGYALFDPGSNQGFIAIRQLPAAEPGKQYRLWLLDTASGRVREAGVLPAANPASGLYFFSVAPGASENPGRLNFFVTAEDSSAPDSSEPRGKVVLGDRRI